MHGGQGIEKFNRERIMKIAAARKVYPKKQHVWPYGWLTEINIDYTSGLS